MRPPIPEMPDDPIADGEPPSLSVLRSKTRAELDDMPYIEKWWTCAAMGCKCRTIVRDYSHPTHFYWRRRFMWRRSYYYLCARHTRLERNHKQTLPRNLTIAELAQRMPFELKPFSEWYILETKTPSNNDRKRRINDPVRGI
jgi:hypothetical protein